MAELKSLWQQIDQNLREVDAFLEETAKQLKLDSIKFYKNSDE